MLSEEDIKILEEQLKQYKRHLENYEKDDCLTSVYYELKKYAVSLEHLIKAYKELEEKNKELISDNLEYQRTLDIFDKRTYRKKYLEERRNEEPNLLYPDADEIYKRYYKLREENTSKQKAYDDCYCEFKHYKQYESIPVSLVEEKIEERKLWLSSNDIGYKDDYVLEVLKELLEKR